jgi:hypothetical protein
MRYIMGVVFIGGMRGDVGYVGHGEIWVKTTRD